MREKNDIEPYVFIFGQSFPRSEIIKLCVIAGFVLLMSIIGGTFLYLDWREGVELREAKVEEQRRLEEVAAEQEVDPLRKFFEGYLKQTRFSEVDSIRAVGVYDVNDIEMDFTFMAKRPRLYRQKLTKADHLIEVGYDGEEVWFNQSHDVVDSSDPSLMQLNRTLAILESTIPCLAWDYDIEKPLDGLQLMPESEWQGHECYVVKNTKLLSEVPVYHYIDKAAGFERYRRASVEIAPGRFRDVELFYDPPLGGSPYPIPSGIELILDGRLYYKVTFDTVDVNKGVPTFLFERPKSEE